MSDVTGGCAADPASDWQEQGWCCRECAILAHIAWCGEHEFPAAAEVIPA